MSTPLEISAALKAILDADAAERDELRKNLESLMPHEVFAVFALESEDPETWKGKLIDIILASAPPPKVRYLNDTWRASTRSARRAINAHNTLVAVCRNTIARLSEEPLDDDEMNETFTSIKDEINAALALAEKQ